MVRPLNGHDKPKLPETHYLDNRIFTEGGIFQEEQEKIFAKVWQIACHESEVEKSGDFRCVRIAGKSLLLVRGKSLRRQGALWDLLLRLLFEENARMVQPLNGHDKPKLPETHYLDNRIFTEGGIFQEEQEKIFAKVWQFACHESEVEKSGDFRCVRIAGKSVC